MSNKFDKTARLYRQVSELVKQINKIPTIKK